MMRKSTGVVSRRTDDPADVALVQKLIEALAVRADSLGISERQLVFQAGMDRNMWRRQRTKSGAINFRMLGLIKLLKVFGLNPEDVVGDIAGRLLTQHGASGTGKSR